MLDFPRWLAARSAEPWLLPDIALPRLRELVSAVGFGRDGVDVGLDAGRLAGLVTFSDRSALAAEVAFDVAAGLAAAADFPALAACPRSAVLAAVVPALRLAGC